MEQRTLWNKEHMFHKIYFKKLINCATWRNIAQLQTLSCFSLIHMERLQQIVWNIFPFCALSCMLHAIYLWNVFHTICFIGVCPAWGQCKKEACQERYCKIVYCCFSSTLPYAMACSDKNYLVDPVLPSLVLLVPVHTCCFYGNWEWQKVNVWQWFCRMNAGWKFTFTVP